MIAQSVCTMNEILFRSKRGEKVFHGIPFHGSIAWKEIDGKFVEMIYWGKNLLIWKCGWITGEEYRARKAEIKKLNIEYFQLHKEELKLKIMRKRKFIQVLFGVHSHNPQPEECSGSNFHGPSD